MLQLHMLAQLTQVVHIEDLLPKLEAADRGQDWVAGRACFSSPPRSDAGLAPSCLSPGCLASSGIRVRVQGETRGDHRPICGLLT